MTPFAIDFSGCPGGEPADPEGECITFEGTIDEDGNFTVQPDGVSFPSTVIQSGDLTIGVSTGVSGPVTGSVDPATGEATFDLPMQVDLDIGNTGTADCRIAVGLDGTTGTSGDVTGASLDEDGRVTVVDGTFAIPTTSPLPGGLGFLCPTVDNTVGLPSDAGDNTATFDLLLVQ
jgi:hypothetical protein